MIYIASLLVGLGVGLVYGSIGLRSPAPPVAALLGLLGMLAGEHAVMAMKRMIVHRGDGARTSESLPAKPERSL